MLALGQNNGRTYEFHALRMAMDESIGLKATVEPRVPQPERRREARSNWPPAACLSCISRMIIVKLQLLFRLRQPRNDCSKFIEYLVPALNLSAIFCALHGFISNER
jgi:hypothetical protein